MKEIKNKIKSFFSFWPFGTPKEANVEEKVCTKVKIVGCSNQFSWYNNIAKIKEEKRENEKIFEVEPQLTEDGWFRTVCDIAGPNVKGFILPQDVEKL